MKKFWIFTLLWAGLLTFLIWSGTAHAFWGGGDDITNNYYTDESVTNNNDVSPTIKTNIKNYYDPKVKVKFDPTITNNNNNTNLNCNKNEVKNKVEIDNTDVDVDINVLKPEQKQKQEMEQKQKQQMQQKQDASNKQAQKTEVTITDNTVVEDKREFYSAPPGPKADVPLVENVKSIDKTIGTDIFDTMTFLEGDWVNRAAKHCDDYEIKEAIFFSNGKGDAINNFDADDPDNPRERGNFAGYLYLYPDGEDVTGGGCQARIIQRAIKHGFTGYRTKEKSYGEVADGDSLNLSLGAGMSIVNHDDDVSASGTGGLGWSEAEAWKEARPVITIEVYFNPARVSH